MKTNTKIIFTAIAGLIGILLLAQPKNNDFINDIDIADFDQPSMNAQQVNYQTPGQELKTSRPTGGSKKIEMKEVVNPKTGQIAGYMPLPENWKIGKESITGPNGIVCKEYPMNLFNNTQRRPMSATQVLNNELAPRIQNAGGKIKNTFPIPGIMEYDKNYSKQLYGMDNLRSSFDVIGVDLIDADGNPAFLIVRQLAFDYGYGGVWGYMQHTLECNPAVYQYARDAYIHGIANTQTNPEQIAAHNRNEARKAEQSWAAHNTRMRNNQAAFEARNRAFTASSNAALDASMHTWRTNNEISDMSMETWKNANASGDRMQDMAVNGIHEWENVYDPASDRSYKVESGYDRYFMNGQGEYFGTNDQFYQPGQDMNLNGSWAEVKRRGN